MTLCSLTRDPIFKELSEPIGTAAALNVYYRNGNKLPDVEDIPGIIQEELKSDHIKERLNMAEEYNKIAHALDNPKVIKDPNSKWYLDTETGDKIYNRVTQLIEEIIEAEGKGYRGVNNLFYAHKGAVMHSYFEEIGKRIYEGKPIDQASIQKEVSKLLELTEFKDRNLEFLTLNKVHFNTLVKGIRSLYSEIQEIQKEIDPNGKAKFYFELAIFDSIKPIAGTIDLAVLFSDGTMGVYDYKTYIGKKGTSPHQGSIDKWGMQLGRYKSILRDMYGVKGFRQSRVIPIQVSYGRMEDGSWVNEFNDGVQSAIMQNKDNREKNAHVDPIPIEEFTGDKNLDILISRLIAAANKERSLLKRARVRDKTRIRNKISNLEQALKNVQLNRDVMGMANDVITLFNLYYNRIGLNPTDPNYMSFEELSDAVAEMNLYTSLSADFKNQLKKIPDKDRRKEVDARLDKAESNAKKLQRSLIEEIEERVGRHHLKAGYMPSPINRKLAGLAEWDIPIFRRLNELLSVQEELTRRKTLAEFKKIKQVHEEFTKWGNANGYSGLKKYELIQDSETGNLHRYYQKEFTDRRKEISDKVKETKKITKEDKEWIDKYFKFDIDEYNRMKKEVFDGYDYDLSNKRLTKEAVREGKKRWLEENDPKTYTQNKYKERFLIPNKETASDYYSDAWLKIKDIKPVRAYYDMFVAYNKEWTEIYGKHKIGEDFIANVRNGFWDNIIEFGPGGLGNLASAYSNSLQIHQEDTMQGVQDENGNSLSAVPLLYTDPVYVDPSDSVMKEIELAASEKYEIDSKEYKLEVKQKKREAGKELGLKIKSKDLTKSLMSMVYSVNTNIEKSAIEGEIKALRTLIQAERVESAVMGKLDQTIIRKAEGDLLKKIGMSSEMIEYFDGFVDMHLYGQRIKSDKKIFGKYSAAKSIDAAKEYMTVKSLGLNWVIQTADYIQSATSMFITGKEGRYFTNRSFKEAMDNISKKDINILNNKDFWQPMIRDIPSEMVELSGATLVSRRLRSRSMFLGYLFADDNIASGIMTAMNKHYIIDSDHKIKNPKIDAHKIINKDAPTVFDSLKENENGELYIENLTIEEFVKYREKIHNQVHQITGNITDRLRGQYSRSLVFGSAMHFRSWVKGLSKARIGEYRYDPVMESIDAGRYNTAYAEILGDGFLPAVRETLKIITEAVSLGIYKKAPSQAAAVRMRKIYSEKYPDQKHLLDGENGIEMFMQFHRDKLNGFVAEIRVYLTLVVLLQLLKGLDWDEPETGIMSYEAHNIARRALLEASFFWNPSTVDEIIKSPIPLWGQLMQLERIVENSLLEVKYISQGKRDVYDKTPAGYYLLKNTPGVNQVLGAIGYFNEYNPSKNILEKMLKDTDE